MLAVGVMDPDCANNENQQYFLSRTFTELHLPRQLNTPITKHFTHGVPESPDPENVPGPLAASDLPFSAPDPGSDLPPAPICGIVW